MIDKQKEERIIEKLNKWGTENIVLPTKKGLQRNKKEITKKERGDKLRQRKKDDGIEECFWTVSNTSEHIDEEHINEMDNL